MKIFHLGWIPHGLTDRWREIRIENCRELPSMLEGSEKGKVRNLVTGDKSWFTVQFQHSAELAVSQDNVPQKLGGQAGPQSLSFTVMGAVDGFHIVNLMKSQDTFSSEHFINNGLTDLLPKIFPQGPRRHALQLHCHLENCRVHFSNASEQLFTENGIVCVLHPPCSPDLAPADFWFFDQMKAALAGSALDRPGQLFDAATTFLEEIQVNELKGVVRHWVERVTMVTNTTSKPVGSRDEYGFFLWCSAATTY
jgi:histone-lysine N-methyltransferase SETMAR